MDVASLAIQIKTGDVERGAKELDKLTEAGKDAEKATSSLAIASGVAAGAVTAAMFSIGRASVQAAIEAEEASNKMVAVLRATGYAAGLTKEQLDDLADSMAESTKFDDESIRNASAVLLTFRNVQGDAFSEGIKLAADLATVLGSDLNSAALQVGKALNDPISGITALSRAGVQFTQVQKDQIKAFVETNQLAKAQEIILGELRGQVGGTAEAMNTGLTKAVNDQKKAWAELTEAIGKSQEVQVGVTTFNQLLVAGFTELKLRIDDTGSSLKGLASFIAGNSEIARLLGLSEGQMAGRPRVTTEIDEESRRLAQRAALLGQERQKRIQQEEADYLKRKELAEKQAKEDQKRNQQLIEEGRKGWIDFADEVFRQADEENRELAKFYERINEEQARLRQQDIAGQVAAAEARITADFEEAKQLAQIQIKQAEEQDKLQKQNAKELESDLKNAFMLAFQASKNPAQAFVDGLANAVFSRVSSSLASALAQAALNKIGAKSGADVIDMAIGWGKGFFSGPSTSGDFLSGLASPDIGFEGGGFTGSGPRAGGMDGKGGFMAMLHPNETVIDHTKGGAAGIVYAPVIQVDSRTDRGEVMRLVSQAVQNGNAQLVDQLQRAGRI